MAEDNPTDEISRIEARLEELAEVAERCRKIILASKAAIAGGGAMLLVMMLGLFGSSPAVALGSIAAVLGGIVSLGSNVSTLRQTMDAISAAEALRSDLIGGIDLRVVRHADEIGLTGAARNASECASGGLTVTRRRGMPCGPFFRSLRLKVASGSFILPFSAKREGAMRSICRLKDLGVSALALAGLFGALSWPASQARSQDAPPNLPTKQDLARDNNLFLSLARKLLKWDEPEEPARIVGPIYFVGTRGLGAFLFTTSEGHVLMNTGMPPSGAMMLDSIRKLGFKPEDIKIMINGHAHIDHAGAFAFFKIAFRRASSDHEG